MKVAESCSRTIALRDGRIVEDVTRDDDPAAADQLAVLPQARAADDADDGRHRARRRGVRRHAHREPERARSRSRSTVDRIAGKTELQVTAGETGFDEEVLETVQSAPTVRVAVPVIEAVVDTNIAGQGNLLVLGVDMTGDRSLRDYDLESGDEAVIDDPLVFLAQPDSLIVTQRVRRPGTASPSAAGCRSGRSSASRPFTVRGIMKSSGLASAFGGNLAIMDIYAAQKMFGRGRTFDRIDLARASRAARSPRRRRELRALLGPGFQVEPPSGRGPAVRGDDSRPTR